MTERGENYGEYYRSGFPERWRQIKISVPLSLTALGLGQEIEDRIVKDFPGRKWCWKLEHDDPAGRRILFAAPRRDILNFISYTYP